MIRGLLLILLLVSVGKTYAQLSDFSDPDFSRADSIAAQYRGESLNNLPVLAHKLTTSLPTPLEKFRAIYTWVSTNIENDYGYYIRNKQKREKLLDDPDGLEEWNNKFRPKVFDKLQKGKSTVCTGYAYLINELAGFVGISCHIIDGYGRTVGANVGSPGIPNHSWNAVQLNNKWYLCDATWSSGSINLQGRTFIKDYNDGYFLADPELFVKNHYPLDTAWLLTEANFSLEAFLNGPLVYKYAFSYNIKPIVPTALEDTVNKGEAFVIRLEVPEEFDVNMLELELGRGSYSKTVNPVLEKIGEKLYELHYKFNRKGKYDVHVKVGRDYIMTYVVQVKKRAKE